MLTEKEKMTQCQLTRPHLIQAPSRQGKLLEHYDCWLPNKYAKVGMVVDIEGKGDGWTVKRCYTELPAAVVIERGQDYKKTRRMSDI